jgi:hypothetical protein
MQRGRYEPSRALDALPPCYGLEKAYISRGAKQKIYRPAIFMGRDRGLTLESIHELEAYGWLGLFLQLSLSFTICSTATNQL